MGRLLDHLEDSRHSSESYDDEDSSSDSESSGGWSDDDSATIKTEITSMTYGTMGSAVLVDATELTSRKPQPTAAVKKNTSKLSNFLEDIVPGTPPSAKASAEPKKDAKSPSKKVEVVSDGPTPPTTDEDEEIVFTPSPKRESKRSIDKSSSHSKTIKSRGGIDKSSSHSKTRKSKGGIDKSSSHSKTKESRGGLEKSSSHRKVKESRGTIEKSSSHRKLEKSSSHRKIDKSSSHSGTKESKESVDKTSSHSKTKGEKKKKKKTRKSTSTNEEDIEKELKDLLKGEKEKKKKKSKKKSAVATVVEEDIVFDCNGLASVDESEQLPFKDTRSSLLLGESSHSKDHFNECLARVGFDPEVLVNPLSPE